MFVYRARKRTWIEWGGVEIANLGISSQNKLFLSFLERVRFKKVGPEKRKRREVLQIPQ